MKRAAALLFIASLLASAQFPPGLPSRRDEPKRMPDGRLQSEAILKDDHERNVAELAKIEELLSEVRKSLEKHGPGRGEKETLLQLEEIERLSKRIRQRMLRY